MASIFKQHRFLFLQIDTDKPSRCFEARDFPSEWDRDYHQVDFTHLVNKFRGRVGSEYEGGLISFPTHYVFSPDKLVEAERLGATVIVLWGSKQDCIEAARNRIRKKGGEFNSPRYERLNNETFRAYGNPSYADFRVDAFKEDASRIPADKLLATILNRAAP